MEQLSIVPPFVDNVNLHYLNSVFKNTHLINMFKVANLHSFDIMLSKRLIFQMKMQI